GDRKKGLKDRTSHAMLYVKGRVPMHLRTNIYDRIEGDELVEAVADRSPSLLMTKEEGKPWLELPCFVSDSDIGYVEESLLKFINLKSPRVPTPPHLAQLHIPDVEQTEMFLWTKDGVLRLASENIPPTTVMRQRAYLIAEARMRDERFQRKFAQTITPIAAEESTPRIRELAESWTVEAEPGWETICAITDRLRQDYEHDPSAAQADETADPFETFLFKEKKGADYMFAASAALMLRELGYQVRIVSGFYASPEKYDSNSEQTPIYVDDAHFWVEVSDGANWHTVEPTPGYETLAPPKDLKTRLAEFVWLIATALWYRKWTLVAIALIGLTIWLLRSAILDLVAQLANRWAVPRDTRRRVLRTLQVIALRERFSRDRRPPGATIHAWLSRKSIVAQEEALLLQSITLCGWALYGGPSACPIPSTQIETLRHFTLELSRRPSSSR
ncbi:MAG: transglutaminase family protein, partial [Blastopirellula sp. JB062]